MVGRKLTFGRRKEEEANDKEVKDEVANEEADVIDIEDVEEEGEEGEEEKEAKRKDLERQLEALRERPILSSGEQEPDEKEDEEKVKKIKQHFNFSIRRVVNIQECMIRAIETRNPLNVTNDDIVALTVILEAVASMPEEIIIKLFDVGEASKET